MNEAPESLQIRVHFECSCRSLQTGSKGMRSGLDMSSFYVQLGGAQMKCSCPSKAGSQLQL